MTTGPKHAFLAALIIGFIANGAGLAGCAAIQKCGVGGCPADAVITAAVEGQLRQHPALEPPNLLSVQTIDRVVYLNGLVDTPLEREMAESVASATPGVMRVVNSIGISGNR
jgi:osmotically-inducible protein OsmY